MTPHELALKTVKDIEKRRRWREKGAREARDHYFSNFTKINRRIGVKSYGKGRGIGQV